MPDVSDMDLVREYARNDSESAFSELVHRHINLVYSVACRYVGNFHDAEEVTQVVFIILAKKAGRLREGTILTGWLYETTRFTATKFLRTNLRRGLREQEAHMQSSLNDSETESAWRQLAPLLEQAMTQLSEKDRTLLALRFYQNKTGAETAALLGIHESAAHKRLSRAVEKLRLFFAKRGVAIPAALLTAALSAKSVQAAPATLAKTTATVAVAKGATASTSTLTLIKGALKLMAWTKAQTAVAIGAGTLLLIGGTATIAVKKLDAYRAYRDSWRVVGLNSQILSQTAPQVRVLPTKFSNNSNLAGTADSLKWGGINVRVIDMFWAASSWPPGRILFPDGEPKKRYDFISTLSQGTDVALQHELKKELGLVGRHDTRDMDVLVLKVRTPNAPGLKPGVAGDLDDWETEGRYVCGNQPLCTTPPEPAHGLGKLLEIYFGKPVVDQTGLTEHYSIDLRWDPKSRNPKDAIKQAVLQQLGLEIVPGREPIEVLVVEKAK